MKVLIAYDGSECATAALEDLKRAGLPKTVEALVISVADVVMPPDDETTDGGLPDYVPQGVRRARNHAEQQLRQAETIAKSASEHLKEMFPEWQVRYEAVADSPAWALISKADQWKADLVVVGARGHSVFGGRLILGSVSQRVLYEAACTVRIARGEKKDRNDPIRVLLAVDNSPDSLAAVDAVCRRVWPKGTKVYLLAVVDTVMAINPNPAEPALTKWIEVQDNWDEVRKAFEPSANKLRQVGLDADVIIRRGDPKDEVSAEAQSLGADCIFLGARGTRGIDRLLLGSVSAAVAARAHCSVEVVRERQKSLSAGG